jgi:DNA-binding Lrp family transcriptional regulator
MPVQTNSVATYIAEKQTGRIDKRESDILGALKTLGKATEREIKKHLELEDMNSVRPRVTELMQRGLLRECGSLIDPSTGRPCRVVCLVDWKEPEANLFDMDRTLNDVYHGATK